MAMTPRARAASPSDASLLTAPRSLNELVTCMFSYLTCTSAPVSAESLGAGSMGVRNTCPAMVRRAASISAMVTLMPSNSGRERCRLVAQMAVPLAPRPTSLHLPVDSEDSKDMTDSGPRKIGVSIELKPHAYDPATSPELFEGVLARRCIAFLVDLVIIAIPVLFAT